MIRFIFRSCNKNKYAVFKLSVIFGENKNNCTWKNFQPQSMQEKWIHFEE